MKTYYVYWIDEPLEVEPSLGDAPIEIEARSPREAWEKFLRSHPNFRDGEGDYYVRISDTPEPEAEQTVVWEAGRHKITGKTFFARLE